MLVLSSAGSIALPTLVTWSVLAVLLWWAMGQMLRAWARRRPCDTALGPYQVAYLLAGIERVAHACIAAVVANRAAELDVPSGEIRLADRGQPGGSVYRGGADDEHDLGDELERDLLRALGGRAERAARLAWLEAWVARREPQLVQRLEEVGVLVSSKRRATIAAVEGWSGIGLIVAGFAVAGVLSSDGVAVMATIVTALVLVIIRVRKGEGPIWPTRPALRQLAALQEDRRSPQSLTTERLGQLSPHDAAMVVALWGPRALAELDALVPHRPQDLPSIRDLLREQ